jgi:hypothetical protein
VFRRREPPLDREVVNLVFLMLARIDGKLDDVLDLLGEDDGEEADT